MYITIKIIESFGVYTTSTNLQEQTWQ